MGRAFLVDSGRVQWFSYVLHYEYHIAGHYRGGGMVGYRMRCLEEGCWDEKMKQRAEVADTAQPLNRYETCAPFLLSMRGHPVRELHRCATPPRPRRRLACLPHPCSRSSPARTSNRDPQRVRLPVQILLPDMVPHQIIHNDHWKHQRISDGHTPRFKTRGVLPSR